jgi:hypothetical protein
MAGASSHFLRMDGMQKDSAAGSPAGRHFWPQLGRRWRPAALGCWTAI